AAELAEESALHAGGVAPHAGSRGHPARDRSAPEAGEGPTVTEQSSPSTTRRAPRTRAPGSPAPPEVSLLSDDDIYLFNEGSHFRLYDKLGAHQMTVGNVEGTYFAVWPPSAADVSAIGDFNGWTKDSHPLRPKASSGIWEGFLPGIGKGANYKFHVRSRFDGYRVDKTDPFASYYEVPPRTASVVWGLDYTWGDGEWMAQR